jgi:excisionase family DNA binding protein
MKWFTTEEAARHIHVRKEYLSNLVRAGDIESHAKPSGRGVLISERALDELVLSWPSGSKSILD